VNSVNPGFVHSEMVDPYVEGAPELMKNLVSRHSAMNRLGEGHEVAAGVVWLCSDAASFVNGTTLQMDGGDDEVVLESEICRHRCGLVWCDAKSAPFYNRKGAAPGSVSSIVG